MTATKIQPGDDLHLTSLMSPHSLNFVTGADRAALLAYGRDVFAAARNSKCLAQIEEPAAPAAVAPRGEYPHEQMDAMALDRYKVVPSNASMLWSHAVVAGDGTQQLYVGREVECQNMARKFAGAFLDGAFAFHSTAAAPTAPAAPALEAPAAPACNLFDCEVRPHPLRYPLAAYHHAPGNGPLHATWQDKPHRIVYDLVAAVRHYAALAASPQAPAAPILGDAERLAAARQDKSLADYWRNRVAGLAEEFTTAEAALYLADRIVADLYDLPQAGVARPAAPAAPAVDADPLGLRDLGEALMETIERNADALKAVGWLGPMDCPSEIVVDLLNLLDEANTTSALGEWVATLEVDSGGGLDYETVPPCTLPPGCYPLYRAAQAKEGAE
ncbi:hypothetical protein Daci_3202 [Delftia acidovorans SPH-1]|uniref:Uncharacterized protein n=1 Tax=Delftia acidovorans (strain DSM 14801 / SPH-1) TaxID=398578 RepID=A9BW24_DELAS|nr:hypothetical protein [Delftia acidovorans]ABX35840.1 hypothetical protein Daci_3202 [Delftia acidovorans SPH-1]